MLKLTLIVEIAKTDLFMQALIMERILVVCLKAIVTELVVSEIGEGTHFRGFKRKGLSLGGGLSFLKKGYLLVEPTNFFVLQLQLTLKVLNLLVQVFDSFVSQFHLHSLLLQVINQLLIIAGILLHPQSHRLTLFLKLPLVSLSIIVVKDLLPIGVARRNIPLLWLFCTLLKVPQSDA